MESQVISWLISLITGAVGGNIAGSLLKNQSLGTLATLLPVSAPNQGTTVRINVPAEKAQPDSVQGL